MRRSRHNPRDARSAAPVLSLQHAGALSQVRKDKVQGMNGSGGQT